MLVDGTPDSSNFIGKSNHGYLLSTRREAIGARRAFREWTQDRLSEGTWGIPVGAIIDNGLQAFDDSSRPGAPEGHASVDFRGLSDGVARKKAKKLRDAATAEMLTIENVQRGSV